MKKKKPEYYMSEYERALREYLKNLTERQSDSTPPLLYPQKNIIVERGR